MERYSVSSYLQFVEPFYEDRDPAHNFRHIQRIVDRLDLLSSQMSPQPVRNMLYFLASFHGLEKRISSSDEFANTVKDFLRQMGWNAEEIADGLERLHRHLKAPVTIEEQVVHDANYVELLGVFGIAKAFTKGGAEGQSYEETADIFEHQFLDVIEFRTPVGKQIASEKRAYTKDFFARLRAEL